MRKIRLLLTTIGESDPRPFTYLARLFHKPRYNELAKITHGITAGKIGILLDIGCGRGILYQWLLKEGVEIDMYVGCDIDRKRLKETRGEKVLCDAHHLPFRSGLIDCIVCSEVLEHLKQPLLAFSNVLKTSSKWVIVTFPDEKIKNALGFRYPEHVSEVRLEELIKLSTTRYILLYRKKLYFAFPPSIFDRIIDFSPLRVRLASTVLKVLSRLLGELCLIKTEILVLMRK